MLSLLKTRWQAPPFFQVDPAEDTAWAQTLPHTERVLHLVYKPGGGVRSAAAYAPGHKLVVDGDKPLSDAKQRQVVAAVASLGVDTVICHSFLPAVASVARALAAQGLRCLGVWHGASTQFHYDDERNAFTTMVAARRAGTLRRLFAVKPGMHLSSSAIEREPLINFMPRVAAPPRVVGLKGAALVPAPNNWVKNFHSNVIAAAAEPRVATVWVTSACSEHFEPDLARRLRVVVSPTRVELFSLLSRVDVVMNASLSECQPMTALEALAHGVPCIAPSLGIEPFDAHPFARLTRASGNDSLVQMQRVVAQVLDLVASDELAPLLQDFAQLWHRVAVQRWHEIVDT